MKRIHSVRAMKEEIKKLQNKTIGFVPTMGFLHDGHLSLVEQAKNDNDIVVMSVFVNPLQFGPDEDFERYPRDAEKDAEVAEEKGVDFLFIPSVDEMYPTEMGITLTVTKGTDVLCGASRPGHFDGVATVLTKLFHLMQPTRAYFGLKDAQQFAIVNTLVTDLDFPVTLVGLPTVREHDGLAKSSRNVYLSEEERNEATILSSSLHYAQKLVVDGMKNPDTIIQEVYSMIKKHTGAEIDYVQLLSYPALQPVSEITSQVILAVAVQYKNARLIDNIILTKDGVQVNKIEGGGIQ